ncbi:MAG TPA: DUF6049 family protein [Actinomycetota bacterium]
MARPIMRRLASPVLALPLLLLLALPEPAARAQEASEVRLTLVSQTPWVSLTQPQLELRFLAENLGTEPLDDLAIGVTLSSRVLSRSAYEASLVADPPIVLDAETLPREGTLEPGATREFEISLTLASPGVIGIDPDHSGVYPLEVDLRSGITSLAALRVPAIFLVRQPELPLRLSWTFVLHHPISFRPDGVFVDPSLELALEAGGRLNGQIRALLELASDGAVPVDVAISPILLTQLGRMRDGYDVIEGDIERRVPADDGGAALAARALDDLQTIGAAPNVSLTALPFSTPELPSLLASGLDEDLPVQLERGRAVTDAFLQTSSSAAILRPPGAALDETTIRALPRDGVTTLIADSGTFTLPEHPLGFAGPATTDAGDAVTAVVPDPPTDALITSIAPLDPVLGAQVALGELATIWQEAPGDERAVALVLGEDDPLPGPFFVPFARAVAGAPWLAPTSVAELTQAFTPEGGSALATPSLRRFATTYVASLRQTRRRIGVLRSMLPADSLEPARLDTMLLLAEARQFLSEPAEGLEFVTAAGDVVEAWLDGITLETVSAITLTSESGGGIPVTVSNEARETMRFAVRLRSQYLREDSSAELELAPGQTETIRLEAELLSTGRFPVRVQVLSPSGRVIHQEPLIVRSTAYNVIALVITIGAGLLMIGVWARRFRSRRTS